MPGARHGLEATTCESRQGPPVAGRRDSVAVAVDHQHRTAQLGGKRAQCPPVADDVAAGRGDQRLGIRVERPADPVLDALRRVRLREASRDEPLGELGVAAAPVDGVHPSPRPVDRRGPPEQRSEHPWLPEDRPLRRRVGKQRADERRAGDPLGREPSELQQELGSAGEAHHHRALRAGGVHRRQAVAGKFRCAVASRVAAAVRAPVPETVHGEHPEMTGEVGDLHLPVARVDQRPGREQEDRLLALSVDLIEEPLAVALDVALLLRVAGAGLLARPTDARALPVADHDHLVHGRASNTRLKGVCSARRKRVKPPATTTSRIFACPACAPSASPTSCDSEAGVQRKVEKP